MCESAQQAHKWLMCQVLLWYCEPKNKWTNNKKALHSHKIITLIYATAGCRSIRILFTFSVNFFFGLVLIFIGLFNIFFRWFFFLRRVVHTLNTNFQSYTKCTVVLNDLQMRWIIVSMTLCLAEIARYTRGGSPIRKLKKTTTKHLNTLYLDTETKSSIINWKLNNDFFFSTAKLNV